ncbi:GNAT family N-acetyltransferase [Halobacteriales archaeon QS_8_69_26]|nr:MAG: GNAT family N-acetyltransferase [Halobacteriales archaeon QS_8_69_26]
MYVRDAKNREEVWLLDHIEGMGLDDTAFRSRDYVVAVDERSGEKAGFGRIRVHKVDDGEDLCELTSVGVLEGWRRQGVGAHVVERLVELAGDQEFEDVYALTDEPDYLSQFGFRAVGEGELPEKLADRLAAKRENIAADAVPMRLAVERFRMPQRLRDRFKHAHERDQEEADDTSAEDFGIDPDSATYKYDTG